MTLPTRRPHVLAIAVLLGASAVATGLSSSPAAGATGGRWTQLSTGAGVGVSNAPGVTRWGSSLLVAWTQATADGRASLKTRVVGADALPAGPESTALTWAALSSDPAVFRAPGGPAIAVGGLRSLDSTDPYNGPVSLVSSGDAVSWSLNSGSLTQTRLGYGDYGIGAASEPDGAPLVALAAGSSDHVTVHHGIDPAVPAAAPDTVTDATGEAQDVGLAVDGVSGAGYAVWYSGSSGAFNGIHAQQVAPSLGARQHAPLSSVSYAGAPASVNPGQNVAVTARVGGGVWAAYGSGYSSPHRLVLWHVGTAATLVTTRPGSIQYVGVSAANGGRLWVWWVEGDAVYAARTNPAVTRLGVVRRVVAPGGASPTRTGGDGALGPLDVVVTAQPGSGPPGIFTTRIVEALRVRVTPHRVASSTGGSVTVLVTDAGVPVPRAAVRVGPVTVRTDAHGRATFRVPPGARTGVRRAVARAPGFVRGSATFRVR
jgi:hypothetical protein